MEDNKCNTTSRMARQRFNYFIKIGKKMSFIFLRMLLAKNIGLYEKALCKNVSDTVPVYTLEL